MGKKKKNSKAEDLSHVRVIQDAILSNDILMLRKSASALGLGTYPPPPPARSAGLPSTSEPQGPPTSPSKLQSQSQAALNNPQPQPGSLRSRAWLALGGLDPHDTAEDDEYEILKGRAPEKDAGVIDVDIDRSLWDWVGDQKREKWRESLKNILRAVCAKHGGDVHYYQGMHDIAAVLLLTMGEKAAYRLLSKLSVSLLRDFTHASLEPAARALALLPLLIEKADPALYAHIHSTSAKETQASRVPPFFALPWLICWFSHDFRDLSELRRLFDLFLASNPLMPLYVAACMMQNQRSRLLASDPSDPADVHHALAACPLHNAASAHELCLQAVFLFRQHPPAALLAAMPAWKRTGVASFCAELSGGRWAVKEPSPLRFRNPDESDEDEVGSDFMHVHADQAQSDGTGWVQKAGGYKVLNLTNALKEPVRRATGALGQGGLWAALLYSAGVTIISPSASRPDLNPIDDLAETLRAGLNQLLMNGIQAPYGLSRPPV